MLSYPFSKHENRSSKTSRDHWTQMEELIYLNADALGQPNTFIFSVKLYKTADRNSREIYHSNMIYCKRAQ